MAKVKIVVTSGERVTEIEVADDVEPGTLKSASVALERKADDLFRIYENTSHLNGAMNQRSKLQKLSVAFDSASQAASEPAEIEVKS